MPRVSDKAARFTESVIREMTRLANLHRAVNLSQGFPDFACPPELKEAAKRAIDGDVNQYAITWGARPFRQAIAARFAAYNGVEVDPERQITVTCGATEAMIATLLALVDPGDEVVVFEPFYENYGPDAILSGARPVFVQLHEPDWAIDRRELEAAFSPRTRAIIVNTPNNPTGKVFTRDELEHIGELCRRYDAIAVCDEIYEHILYDGARHVSLHSVPGMAERTVTINAMSKTYSVTGWRVGWAIASPELTAAIRKVHDFLTVGAPAPLQEAGVVALDLPESYYAGLQAEYGRLRDLTLSFLARSGFRFQPPRGAYYVMTDIGGLGAKDDVAFARHLVEEVGVAVVPRSSFYARPEDGRSKVRFCYCKREATLAEAARRLAKLGGGNQA